MARPATVNYDDFHRKAIAVKELYGRVTYERMREFLGTGSMSTYKPLMERWRKEQQDHTDRGVPKSLTDRIDVIVRDVYQQIAHLAEADKRAAVDAAQGALEKERYRADRAEAQALESQNRVDTAQAELAKMRKRQTELTESRETLLTELEIAKAGGTGEGGAEVEDLQRRLRERTAMLAATRRDLQKSDQHSERLEQELRDMRKAMEAQYAAINRSLTDLARHRPD